MRSIPGILCWLFVFWTGSAAAGPAVDLNAVLYPDKDKVELRFAATPRAAQARVEAEVVFEDGQARIELSFDGLKSPVLFGGDVTAYVLWAVTRDGGTENLGEVWGSKGKGSARYSTGKKVFAMMVTAESTYLAERPSELLLYRSLAPEDKGIKTTPFAFAEFKPAPAHDLETIADYEYAGKTPLELLQAEKVYALAERSQGGTYAPEVMRDAEITLAQARGLSLSRSNRDGMVDYARRSVALSTDAMRTAARRIEAKRLEEEIARRKAEMEALVGEAEASQKAAEEARAEQERLLAETRTLGAEAARAREDRAVLAQEMKKLQDEKAFLIATRDKTAREREAAEAARADLQAQMAREQEAAEAAQAELQAQTAEAREALAELQEEQLGVKASMAELEASKAGLEDSIRELGEEKAKLSRRLEGALQSVAETKQSARGLIVNLPDILFDSSQATLKEASRVTLAKLAGILLIMPELNLRVEGHTDSVGKEEYNLRLSEQRAVTVTDFLRQQGVGSERMTPAGYGMARPVADNGSEAGRAKNRRVEIVIAQGVVQEEPAPAAP